MNVLVFSSLYPNNIWPNHGVFIKERMTQFAKLEGCNVRVIAPVPYFPTFKVNWRWRYSQVAPVETRDGIEVYHPRYFITPKLGMTLYGLMMFISVLPTVKKVQRDFNFDLIDAHYIYPDGFAAVLLGRLFHKPVVVSARGSDVNQYSGLPVIRRLLQYTLTKADGIIAVCVALKKAIVDLGVLSEKVDVVPNGVDIGKFYRVPKIEARKRLGLPVDKKIVLSVGGLIPRKGFDLLIKASKLLAENRGSDDVYIVIVGDGPNYKQLEDLKSSIGMNEHIYLAGPVPHQNLFLWYSAADLFCLASSREGWPNVLLESLACGTPVVATNVWGVPEVISSDKVGVLIGRTEQALAEGLAVALEKSWRADDLVEYATNHTWEQTAKAVRRVFESILNKEQKLRGTKCAQPVRSAQA